MIENICRYCGGDDPEAEVDGEWFHIDCHGKYRKDVGEGGIVVPSEELASELLGAARYDRPMKDIFPPFVMDGLEVEVFTMPKGTIRYFQKYKAFRIYDGEDWFPMPWTFKHRMLALGYRIRDSRFGWVVRRFWRKLKNLKHLRVTCSPKHECDCW